MEDSLSSEHTVAVRGDNGRESISDGIGVDGEREYQTVCGGGHQCGSVGTCMLLIQGSYLRLPLTSA